jgi:hypothetical protein
MALSVLVSDVMLGIRRRVDAERDTDFLPDAELISYINTSMKRLHRILAEAYPERFRKEVLITSDGSPSYDLPADWLGTIGVDRQCSIDDYDPLYVLNEFERNRYPATTRATSRAYRALVGKLWLYPTPVSGQVYRHVYLPTPTPITASGDTIDGILGLEELIELDVAVRITLKEEGDASAFAAERDRMVKEAEDVALLANVMTARRIAVPGDSCDWDD